MSDQRVECRDEAGREQGLGFMLDCLRDFGVLATFYMESLNAAYFGTEAMRRHAVRIAADGHCLGLHTHPCWLTFANPDWLLLGRQARHADSLCGRPYDEVVAVLGQALEWYQSWGLGFPRTARMGNMAVDRLIYRAFHALGIETASNIGMGVYQPTEAALQLFGGCHTIEGVHEFPAASFPSPLRRRPRTLTFAGSSWFEFERLLLNARRRGTSPIVILTHPFEFAQDLDGRFTRVQANQVTQDRLRRLCKFLAQHSEDFVARRVDDLEFRKSHEAAGVSTTIVAEAATFGQAAMSRLWQCIGAAKTARIPSQSVTQAKVLTQATVLALSQAPL